MYKLIIVDDEINICKGLTNYLEWNNLGYEIAGNFYSGAETLNYIHKFKTDVILTDIKMPEMSGIDLAQHIYEEKLDIQLVLLSGYADFEYARKAIIYGVKDYLLKPVKYDEIVSIFYRLKNELDISRGLVKSDDTAEGYYDIIVETVMKFMEENYSNATLESAALKVSLSPNYLSKIFRQKTGKKFSELLHEVKMKKALELLNDINLKTYDISFLIGYDNPKNFTRAFKGYYGKTPMEYRKKEI